MSKPILGISMGDPFGSGPEITVKALADKSIYDRCKPLVVGDVSCMEYAAKVAKKVSGIDVKINPVKDVKDAKFEAGTLFVGEIKETAKTIANTCITRLALEKAGISTQTQTAAEEIITNLKALTTSNK